MNNYKWHLILLNLCLLAFIVALQLFVDYSPAKNTPLSRINSVVYDLRFQWFPPQRDPIIPIVIIDIDEASLQSQGRWPWDRTKVATMIQSLQQHGVALIGFDVVFSEPSENPIHTLLQSQRLSPDLNESLLSLSDSFDSDLILSQSLGFNTVLGYFFHADGGKVGSLPAPIMQLDDELAASFALADMPDYTATLPQLMENALSSGFVVAVPDADGIVRRMPLIMRHDNSVYTSLGLEMTRLAIGAPWVRLNIAEYDNKIIVEGLRVGRDLSIPLDENGNMLVAYKGGAHSFPTVSASLLFPDAKNNARNLSNTSQNTSLDSPNHNSDVNQSEQDKSEQNKSEPTNQSQTKQSNRPAPTLKTADLSVLDGAIVLVGSSALGLSDLRTMPLQTAYPGVEVHANIIDTLVQAAIYADNPDVRSPIYYHPDWEAGASLATLLFIGLVLAFWLPSLQSGKMVLIGLTCTVLVVFANIALWHWWHLDLPVFLHVLLLILMVVVNVVAGYLITNQQKRMVQNLFGEYVPPEYVEQMLAKPDTISLEGEQRDMTVLFADVRQFTAVSESLNAAELKSMLNRYLSAITEVIFLHHGTIDKYVGDLVMAFWNAPLDDDKHAENGVAAAIAMQKRMLELRQEFKAEGLPQLNIGIGLNTGPMNVGDMGSSYRRAYTVLGDAVNLASRLESLTATYGVPILVSDITMQLARNDYLLIDRVIVKGKSQAIDIFQPMVGDIKIDGLSPDQMQQHHNALDLYFNMQWDAAIEAFNQLLNSCNSTKLYQMYIDRIQAIKAGQIKIPADWGGVYVHDTK